MFTKKPERATEGHEGDIPVERERPAAPTPTPPASTFVAKTSAFAKGSGKSGPSIIGEDLTINGNVISKGEVQIDGEVQGDVHCNSLVVGDKATISGGVLAEDVIIRGRVQGSVRAQRVTLQATSHVEGDIHHTTLSIEQGAYFEGKSRRADNPTAPAKGDSSDKPASPPAQQSSGGQEAKSGTPQPNRAAE